MTQPYPCEPTGAYPYDPFIHVLWTTTLVNPFAPAVTGITGVGAIDITDAYCLTDIVGWEVDTEVINAPPWGPFVTQRVGGQSVQAAVLVFAADRQGLDVRTIMARRAVGTIIILPSGPFLQNRFAPINIYPVRIAGLIQRQRLRAGGSQIEVTFAIRDTVGENVVVPP